MPQLHCYVPDAVAERVQRKAQQDGVSVSRFLGDLVKREIGAEWPEGFFEEIVGAWRGDPLTRPAQGLLEQRDNL